MVIYTAIMQAWSRNNNVPPIVITQGDALSRALHITIKDQSGAPIDLIGATVKAHFAKADGTVVYISGDVLSQETGLIQVVLTSQVSAIARPVIVTIQILLPDGGELYVKGLTLNVQPNDIDGSILSSNEYGVLKRLINEINAILAALDAYGITVIIDTEPLNADGNFIAEYNDGEPSETITNMTDDPATADENDIIVEDQ